LQELKSFRIIRLGRYGEMVDTKDLKSFARLERPGSSPGGGTTITKIILYSTHYIHLPDMLQNCLDYTENLQFFWKAIRFHKQ
jgi:hypothetical protein